MTGYNSTYKHVIIRGNREKTTGDGKDLRKRVSFQGRVRVME